MKKALLAFAIILGTASAQAYEAPAWACNLSFKGVAKGFKVILGSYQFNGKGDLKCVSFSGETAHYPVNVTMKAKPLSPQVAFGRIALIGQALEISLFDADPESILGNYLVAQAQGAVIAGAGIITATRIDLPTFAVKIALQFAKGFGVNVGLTKMNISLDQERL